MAEKVTVTLDDVKLMGPFTGTNKKGNKFEYQKLILISDKNVEFSKMQFDTDMPVSPGDTVEITFQTNKGKNNKVYNNIIEFEKVENVTPTESTPKAQSTTTQSKSQTKRVATQTQKQETQTTGVDWARKDLSMEVSGLIQALISTGSYTQNDELASDFLENDLNTVMQIKRRAMDNWA